LTKLRELFETCITPQQCSVWIDALAKEALPSPPYADILDLVAEEQKQDDRHAVDLSVIRSQLRSQKNLSITQEELVDLCRALSRMAPKFVSMTSQTIEVRTKPAQVLASISSMLAAYPEADRITLR
jgi:hypothetical protein